MRAVQGSTPPWRFEDSFSRHSTRQTIPFRGLQAPLLTHQHGKFFHQPVLKYANAQMTSRPLTAFTDQTRATVDKQTRRISWT